MLIDHLESVILNSQDHETDDCTDCEFKGVTTCKNQCVNIEYKYIRSEA